MLRSMKFFSTLSLFTSLLLALTTAAQTKPLTAREVIARIQSQVGVPWQKETVDTFKAGDPDTPVTGIAVTMMATMDVLQRAAASGHNLIITHEPTFFDHLDNPQALPESDAVLAEKRAFIKGHHLVVFRFHDHWHRRTPDGIEAGMVRALGWEKFQNPTNQYLFTLPEISLVDLAGELTQRLGPPITGNRLPTKTSATDQDTAGAISRPPVLRVVGDPAMKVTKVALSPGAAGFARETHALERDDVELLIVGETREWETVEYVADAQSQGKRKALIILGHIPAEQAGMEECTRWLRTFLSGIPIDFVPAAQPFWTPAATFAHN